MFQTFLFDTDQKHIFKPHHYYSFAVSGQNQMLQTFEHLLKNATKDIAYFQISKATALSKNMSIIHLQQF